MALFYHLFKTTCTVDGSAYFGIRGNNDPMWDMRIDYVGRGDKLRAKINQYGPRSFNTEVLYTSSDLPTVERYIKGILTPATYADPRCLNTSREEIDNAIAEGKTGTTYSNDHKLSISISMQENENALGHVKSEESRAKSRETLLAKKLKWIHNKVTREEMQLSKEEIDDGMMLEGFELGRLPGKLKKMGPVPPSGQWRDLS